MTKAQIEYLKLLGYSDTQEDGAILQHKEIGRNGGYVWQGEKFRDVMARFRELYKREYLRNVARKMIDEI